MLGQLMSAISGNGLKANVGGGLGAQINTQIPNWEKHTINSRSRLPRSVSKNQVVRAVQQASELEGQAQLIEKFSKAWIRQAKAALEIRKTRMNHSKEMMGISAELARDEASYLKAIERYGLNMSTAEAEVTGYQRAMNGAQSLIKF